MIKQLLKTCNKDEWLEILISNPDMWDTCPYKDEFTSEELLEWAQVQPNLSRNKIEILLKILADEPELLDSINLISIIPNPDDPLLTELICSHFSKASLKDWKRLVYNLPKLVKRCPFKRKLGPVVWFEVLKFVPEYACECPCLNKITDWETLLAEHASLIEYCPNKELHKLTSVSWCRILTHQPALLTHFRVPKLQTSDYVSVLAVAPELATTFRKWHLITPDDWEYLLINQPQFADKCKKWDKISTEGYIEMMAAHPEFAERFNAWDDVTNHDWSYLLRHQPNLIKCLHRPLDKHTWVDILEIRPEISRYCTCFHEFSVIDWSRVISPRNYHYIPPNFLKDPRIYTTSFVLKRPDIFFSNTAYCQQREWFAQFYPVESKGLDLDFPKLFELCLNYDRAEFLTKDHWKKMLVEYFSELSRIQSVFGTSKLKQAYLRGAI